ncbi:MAG: hypothetical protein MJY43_00245 [Bacteroidales bacterium]|nr:hypothetical protein [Bacteroidales bacterium]
MSSSKFILILSGLLVSLAAHSQVPPDFTPVYELDSIVVSSTKRTNGIKGDVAKGLSIKMSSLATFPKTLGVADPLKFAQSLPGVTTNSEWENGLKIQGCEASQSAIKLCDVPVFNQGRILGLFSVFNPGHFKEIRFSTSTSSRRIGGELGLDTSDTLSRVLNGEANLGPISAYFTLAFPTGRKSSLTISGRRSFIDVFYKGLLKMDGAEMNYKFYDVNASYLYVPDKYNTIDANAYFGMDDGYVNADKFSGNIGAVWSSVVANVRWRHHKDDLDVSTQAYLSTYFMSGNLVLGANAGRAEDYIADAAVHSVAKWRGWEFAAEADYYDIQPQNIFDLSSTSPGAGLVPKQQSVLATLRSSRRLFDGDFALKPSLAVSLYSDISDKNLFPRIDPEISAEYNFYEGGRLSLDMGFKHQYLFMTGMTSSGFPVEFWLGCGKYSKPQASLFGTLSYSVNLPGDAFSINLQTYGKRMWNMVEYSGYLSELLGGSYNLQNMLLNGDGYNYGVTAQVQKNSGKLTGWISYSWTRALRRFDNPDFPYIYPSAHEREHEFKAVASYRTGRWEFGGNFIFTSGLPYTPVSSVYFLNQNILVKYGERNSKRLSPYIRLDLSASFNIRCSGRFRDGINISVQNVTARDNQMTAVLKVKDGKYSYAPATLSIPVMPSINYYCRF